MWVLCGLCTLVMLVGCVILADYVTLTHRYGLREPNMSTGGRRGAEKLTSSVSISTQRNSKRFTFEVLKSISRLHDLAPCSSWALRACNDTLVGRRVNGGRRLSRPDVWFYVKDVSYSRVLVSLKPLHSIGDWKPSSAPPSTGELLTSL